MKSSGIFDVAIRDCISLHSSYLLTARLFLVFLPLLCSNEDTKWCKRSRLMEVLKEEVVDIFKKLKSYDSSTTGWSPGLLWNKFEMEDFERN